MSTSTPEAFKVLLVGEHSVGKTSLRRAFADPGKMDFSFDDGITHSYDASVKQISVGRHQVELQVGDLNFLIKSFVDFDYTVKSRLADCQAVMICVNPDDKNAEDQASEWRKQLMITGYSGLIMLVGTKDDIGAKQRNLQQIADRVGIIHCICCSSRDAGGVERMFETAYGLRGSTPTPELAPAKEEQDSGCCSRFWSSKPRPEAAPLLGGGAPQASVMAR